MGSKKFTLNWADISKIGKNALLVGGAAALGLDTAIKWLKDNKNEE